MILFVILAWAGLASFYLLLAGQLSPSELGAGAALATGAAAYACIAHLRAERALSLPKRWKLVALTTATRLFPDAARVGWALLLGRQGALASQEFRTGNETAQDAAHRAVAILAVSAAPNAFVVTLDDKGQTMLLHHLAPRQPSRDREWPE